LAVRDYLNSKGLPEATLISFQAQGLCCYIASNATDAGRATNRRVEIEFYPAGHVVGDSEPSQRLKSSSDEPAWRVAGDPQPAEWLSSYDTAKSQSLLE